jgi:hypothetical protein
MVLANLPLVAFATSFCQPSACSFVVRNICRNCERQVTRNILSIVVSRSASETEQGRGMHRALTVEAPRGIVLVHGGVPLPTRQRGAARSLVSTAPPPHLPLSQARLEARPPCQSGSHADDRAPSPSGSRRCPLPRHGSTAHVGRAVVEASASMPRKNHYGRIQAPSRRLRRSPCRRLADARHVFDRFPDHDAVSYSTLLPVTSPAPGSSSP